ncbi:MAG: pyridoxamine 5'-phosphate oxidase family protein [Sedimentisphaerales bacterium]|nr:pyridoxamine 5'-phosphate oxidase family protein [Sedimentisphaerales bacterium]
MDLEKYFKKAKGIGILATADAAGDVDAAIYAKPQIIDEHTIALVMRERLSLHNIKRNPKAVYTFIEDAYANKGVRLYLGVQRQETNVSLVEKIIEQQPEICPMEDDANKYLVYFNVEKKRELTGEKLL